MGFFRFADDPDAEVHLMPYGLWKCAGECARYPGLENASVGGLITEEVPSPFGKAIARFGTKFIGNTVSSAYRADDGKIEQIYQNVVLFQDNTSPLGVSLRPISVLLDQADDQYDERQEGSKSYFREIKEGYGFYIPDYFMEFIDRYNGFVMSGEPISRLIEVREGVWQQCFENYCLLFDAKAEQADQVRLLPQGQKYKESYQKDTNQLKTQPVSIRDIQLDIWEQLPQITSQESQQIGACIHDSGNPLINAKAVLTISASERGSQVLELEPTDTGGCSFLKLDPIQAQNGTTVDYQVCFFDIGDQEYCQRDSFLIWGNTEEVLINLPENDQSDPIPSENQLIIDTWELQPQISSVEIQEIGACVHQDDQPLVEMNARLVLENPSTGLMTYTGDPTDTGGCSFFRLDPVQAKNGETIPYKVCFINKYGENYCKRDSFLIWGNP
jgi:hypothetical protein